MTTGRLVATIGLLAALLPALARGDDPITVRATVGPGSHYVGQAIPLALEVEGLDASPTVVPPALRDADLTTLGSHAGDDGRRREYRLVARRPGPLVVPSFRVESGGRIGRSAPIRLAIAPVPKAGMPPAFLGGVGPIELDAVAEPAEVRVGAWIEYRVTLRGPGAIGSTRTPELGGLDRLGLGLRIEPMPPESTAEPPSRTFRWRLRPTRAGIGSLPPLVVATFDPASGRFLSRATSAAAIRADEVAGLDPGSIAYEPPAPSPSRRAPAWWPLAASAAGLGAAGLVVLAAWRRSRRRLPLARLAERLARRIESSRLVEPEARARAVLDALAEYLGAAVGRPPGALTPSEARNALAGRSADATIPADAARLVAGCDRASFAGANPPAEEGEALAREAAGLFRRLARGVPQMPREAAETP